MTKELKSVKRKIKKPRKKVQLTPSQQKAMEERMAKLREARKAKRGDGAPKHIHSSVTSLPEEHTFSLQNVRRWIKHNRELLSTQRTAVRQKMPGALMRYEAIRGYISDMEFYLRTGDWISNFYGLEGQNRTKWRAITEVGYEDYFHSNKRLVKDGKKLKVVDAED